MTTESISQLLSLAFQLSGITPSRGIIEYYLSRMEAMDPQIVERGLERYVNDPQGKKFTIGLLQDLGSGNCNAADAALEASGAILKLIERFGHPNEREAREYAGPLLWAIIERVGGWQGLCQTATYENWPTTSAQIREVAKSVTRRVAAGGLEALDRPEERGQLQSTNDLLKQLFP
jgi:hypothetical protein